MSRTKGGTVTHARHKKVIKAAKGYYGRRKNTFKVAKQAVDKANQYATRDRRARKRPVLVRAVDGSCEFCNMAVPAHLLGEIWGGKRVHTCRGCGCWFRDAVDTTAEVAEDEDAE